MTWLSNCAQKTLLGADGKSEGAPLYLKPYSESLRSRQAGQLLTSLLKMLMLWPRLRQTETNSLPAKFEHKYFKHSPGDSNMQPGIRIFR